MSNFHRCVLRAGLSVYMKRLNLRTAVGQALSTLQVRKREPRWGSLLRGRHRATQSAPTEQAFIKYQSVVLFSSANGDITYGGASSCWRSRLGHEGLGLDCWAPEQTLIPQEQAEPREPRPWPVQTPAARVSIHTLPRPRCPVRGGHHEPRLSQPVSQNTCSDGTILTLTSHSPQKEAEALECHAAATRLELKPQSQQLRGLCLSLPPCGSPWPSEGRALGVRQRRPACLV